MSTYAEKVNSLVAQADEHGALPEGVEADEGLQFAVSSELRRRNTQSEFTKGQQSIKTLQAENSALASNWQKDAINKISAADKAELEELKVQDPEAWRTKITELERANQAAFTEKTSAIKTEASQLTELEQREADLAAFNKANPEFALTDDVLANDVPPRLTNQLKNGDIAFSDFLEKVKKYVDTPKKVQTTEAPNEPNFAGARGGQEPGEDAVKAQNSDDYSKELY